MFAWILNTSAVSFGSVASTTRVSAAWARGGGPNSASARRRSATPISRIALPKYAGDRWPASKPARSNGGSAARTRSTSSASAAMRGSDCGTSAPSISRTSRLSSR